MADDSDSKGDDRRTPELSNAPLRKKQDTTSIKIIAHSHIYKSSKTQTHLHSLRARLRVAHHQRG